MDIKEDIQGELSILTRRDARLRDRLARLLEDTATTFIKWADPVREAQPGGVDVEAIGRKTEDLQALLLEMDRNTREMHVLQRLLHD